MEINKYTKVVGNGCKELRCKLVDVISAPRYGVLSWTDDNVNIPEDLYHNELITDAETKKSIADKIKRDYELCGLDAKDAEEVTDTGIVAYIEGYVVHLVFELPDGKRFVFNNLGDEILFNHKVDIDTIEVMEIGELLSSYCNLKTFNNYDCILEISCDKHGIENRCSDEHAEAMAYAIMQYEESHGNNISMIEAYEKVAARLGDYKFDDLFTTIKRSDNEYFIDIKHTDEAECGGYDDNGEYDYDGSFENYLPDELANIDSLLGYFNDKIVSFSIDYDDFVLVDLEILDSLDDIPKLYAQAIWW